LANLSGNDRARYVQEMFSRIAPRYDLMNRLMTAGQDMRWRREVIQRARLPSQGRILDLGAGTGDLAFEALRQQPEIKPFAADFTLEMMRRGKHRQAFRQPEWTAANALNLPFAENSFDAVVSGFLLRNVVDTRVALREQMRVLRPGGRLVALDTTRPRLTVLSPLIHIHLHLVIPFLGRVLTGQGEAYQYLPDSTEAFLPAELLAARMSAAGLRQVGYRLLMFGTVAIHWGEKP
jgi:demethylmenaquinone methyltransferase/2-methoxy-6-polyprenyl-1,4-benzoquinol methylase